MSFLPNNSTNTPLLANQEFIGESDIVDREFVSVQCSFDSNVPGVVEFYHSIDGFSFATYGDSYPFPAGSHSRETSTKGRYFKIRFINGNENQTSFNLFCKLNRVQSEDINVNTNYVYDSMTVYANPGGFNIRELTTSTDKVSIPRLEQTLTTDSGVSALQCKITSMPAIVIPPITISDINIHDSNGADILANSSGYLQTQIMNSSLTVNTISGFATSANQVTAQASLNSLVTGTRIQASNGNLITVDANNNLNTVVKNDVSISGITSLATAALQTSANTLLTDIKNKTLDSSSDSVTVYAGGEDGLNIRTLSGTVDSVDVGLGIYTWSNREPPFPASRDVLSVQLCGVNDLAGSTLINLVSNPQGVLLVDTGLTYLNVTIDNIVAVTGDFYPSVQGISGHVIVDNQISVTGAFYPEIQSITGHVIVDNQVSVTGVFYPEIQSITGHVIVDNQISVTGAFYPEIQSITGHVIVDNQVSVTGVFYPSIQPVSGNINILNNNLSISGLNFDTNSYLNVHVQNEPIIDSTNSSILIYGSDGITTIGIKTDNQGQILIGNNSFTVDGTVSIDVLPDIDAANNSIQIFGNDGTTTKKAIRTNTNGELRTEITNNISGYALETNGNLALIKSNTDNLDNLNFNNADTNKPLYVDTQLTKINSYLYGSTNGNANSVEIINTDGHNHVLTRLTNDDGTVLNTFASNGGLNVEVKNTAFFSKTQDGSGANITSSSGSGGKQGLDVNVIGGGSLTNYALETGGVLDSIKTNTNRIKSDGTISDAIQVAVKNTVGVSGSVDANCTGSVTVNTISGFALETGGNLASIKTNTDRIKSDTVNADAIQVQVKNASLTTRIQGNDGAGVFNDVYVDANGFLTSNIIEAVHQNIQIGFDANVNKLTKYNGSSNKTWQNQNPYSKTQNGWYVSGIATSSAQLMWYNNGDYIPFLPTATTTFNTQYNFTFSDIDIFYMIIQNYNCSSTLNFPQIIVMSKPTGTGDVAPYAHSIWIYSIDSNQFINNGSAVMIYNGNLARVKTNDVEAPRISYSLTSTIGDGGVNEIIGHISMETIASGGATNIIDMNVIEGAIYVKNKGLINYYFTNDRDNAISGVNVLSDYSNNSVTSNKALNPASSGVVGLDNNSYIVGYNRYSGENQNTYISATLVGSNANVRALDVYSHTSCVNSSSGNLNEITSTIATSGVIPEQLSHKCMDTFIRNGSTQVVNYGQTTVNGIYGINMYQIYPKKIHYTLAGRSESGAEGVIMGGTGSQKFIYDFTFGKANPQTFSAILSAGTTTSRTLKYHYVDSLGDLKTDGSITISTTANVNLTPSNIISVNKFWIDGIVGATEQALIRVGTGNTAINTIASSDYNDYYCGAITCPNGYIMYLSQFSLYTPGAIWVNVQKWHENSTRTCVYTHFNGANAPVSSGYNGSIGGIFTAGETIAFARGAAGASTISGNIVLEPI